MFPGTIGGLLKRWLIGAGEFYVQGPVDGDQHLFEGAVAGDERDGTGAAVEGEAADFEAVFSGGVDGEKGGGGPGEPELTIFQLNRETGLGFRRIVVTGIGLELLWRED